MGGVFAKIGKDKLYMSFKGAVSLGQALPLIHFVQNGLSSLGEHTGYEGEYTNQGISEISPLLTALFGLQVR